MVSNPALPRVKIKISGMVSLSREWRMRTPWNFRQKRSYARLCALNLISAMAR
jgi:hypothetical protein